MEPRDRSEAAPIRVGVIDDHPVIAVALRQAAAGATDGRAIEVRGEASNLADGLQLAERDDLDVLVCDLQLDDGAEGLTILARARQRRLPVLVLSAFGRTAFATAAFERGASGFVTKTSDVDAIIDAIRRIAAGGTAFGSDVLDAVRAIGRVPSPREIEVMRAIAAGRSTEEIAAALGLSGRTVESQVRRLFDRFGVVSRAELVTVAERSGWLSIPPA